MRGIASASAALLLAACAGIGSTRTEVTGAGSASYEQAVALFDAGDFGGANAILRQLASSCRSGNDGKRSLLLLSTLWLEPRNAKANPDSAALPAAHALMLPDADHAERMIARSLYLLALDLGADPRAISGATPSAFAASYSRCGQAGPQAVAALPVLDRESTVGRLERQRDSLSTRTKELSTELQAAQAEIQRIRKLLGGRDTTKRIPRGN